MSNSETVTQIRELDAYVTKGMRDWEIPDLSIAIVRNDSVLFTKGYGVRLPAAGAIWSNASDMRDGCDSSSTAVVSAASA